MRICYLASRVPDRRAFDPQPIDVDRLVELASEHSVVAALDETSAHLSKLEATGVRVITSPKRPVFDGVALLSADAVVAAEIAAIHAQEPFDEIWCSSDGPGDPAWFESALSEVTRVVILPSTPTAGLRRVWSTPSSIERIGLSRWALSGALTAADVIATDVDPGWFGLDTSAMPSLREIDGPPVISPVSRSHGTVALVSLTSSTSELLDEIAATRSHPSFDDDAALFVIHADAPVGATSLGTAVFTMLDADDQRSTAMIAVGDGADAAEFLMTATFVACATPADAAVPVVREALASAEGWVIRETPPALPRTARPTPASAVHLIPVDDTTAIGAVLRDMPDDRLAVLHTSEGAELAASLASYPRSVDYDVVAISAAGGIYGGSTDRIASTVVGIGPRIRASVAASAGASSLAEVIASLFDPSHVATTSLLVLPSIEVDAERTYWVTSSMPLVGGRTAFLGGPTVLVPTSTPDPSDPAPSAAPREWLEGLSWSERAMLLLPWRWGLLSRAMRDKW
jgi:hypothetical protein